MRIWTLLLLLYWMPNTGLAQEQVHLLLPSDNPTFHRIYHKLSQLLATQDPTLHLQVHQLSEPWQPQVKAEDLVIVVGGEATKKVISETLTNPYLFVFIPSTQLSGLLNQPQTSWAAVVVDQPLKRLVALGQKLQVNESYRKKVLLALSDDNKAILDQLAALPLQEAQLLEVVLIHADEVAAKVLEAKLFDAAAIIAVSDQRVWSGNNARWLLRQAYNHQVPVIGYSKAFLKAGALVSAYSTFDQLVEKTAGMVAHWHQKGTFDHPKINYADFQVELNASISRALRIDTSSLEASP